MVNKVLAPDPRALAADQTTEPVIHHSPVG
ncbi:MAG: hypothetical protein JWQ97_200, partial [Phenylobacterium sp.]|nr:hypothetical protein [Phenylobacterium sp.]